MAFFGSTTNPEPSAMNGDTDGDGKGVAVRDRDRGDPLGLYAGRPPGPGRRDGAPPAGGPARLQADANAWNSAAPDSVCGGPGGQADGRGARGDRAAQGGGVRQGREADPRSEERRVGKEGRS